MERARASDAVRVRCDLSPTGQTWDLAAFVAVARLLAPHQGHPGAGWLFTADVLEVDGLDMEDAISVARGLVYIATAGRFLREPFDPDAIPVRPVMPAGSPRTPTERSDR